MGIKRKNKKVHVSLGKNKKVAGIICTRKAIIKINFAVKYFPVFNKKKLRVHRIIQRNMLINTKR
jgi:hypothetical protein